MKEECRPEAALSLCTKETLQESRFSFNFALICQNNQNTLEPLTSQLGLCTDKGGKCSDMQYPEMFTKRGGGSSDDAGDPCCQPRVVARMRTNTVGSSHDSVGLS